MKLIRKFILRCIIYMTDQHLLYEDMVLKKHIFPQKLGEQQLLYLLNHSRNHVPIYKNLPMFKSYEEFSKSKYVLKKDVLKENIWQAVDMHYSKKDILGKNPFLNLIKLLTDFLIPISTSGSTGKPLHFFKNKRTGLIALFSWIEAVKYLGWDEGAKVMTCWQQVITLAPSSQPKYLTASIQLNKAISPVLLFLKKCNGLPVEPDVLIGIKKSVKSFIRLRKGFFPRMSFLE